MHFEVRNTGESRDTQSKAVHMVVPELSALPPLAAIQVRASLAARLMCQQDLELCSRDLPKGTAGTAR